MNTAVKLKSIFKLYGRAPANSVFDYRLNVFVFEGFTGFVTRVEVEYFTEPSSEGRAAAENVSVLVPGSENEVVGLGNKERLGIQLLVEREMRGYALRDGVSRAKIPKYRRLISAPGKIPRRAEDGFEGLGMMSGMKRHKAHTAKNSCADLCNELIRNVVMAHMTPPKKDVGLVKKLVGESLLGLVKRADRNVHILFFIKKRFDICVYSVGIYCFDGFVSLFVMELIPYGYVDCHVGYLVIL